MCDTRESSRHLCHCGKEIGHNLCSTIQSHAFDVCKYGSSDSDELSQNPSQGSEQNKIASLVAVWDDGQNACDLSTRQSNPLQALCETS